MNELYHIKRLRNALERKGGNMYEKQMLQMRVELGSEMEDDEDRVMVALLDLIVEFINPMQRAIVVIGKRLREVLVMSCNEWSGVAVGYRPLKIKEFYAMMRENVSPEVKNFIINRLECTAIVKGDLIEALENDNVARFERLIRKNGVDYGYASRVIAYLTALDEFKENGQNGVVEIDSTDENSSDEVDRHQLILMQRFTKEHLMNFMSGIGIDGEDVAWNAEMFDRYYDAINEAYMSDRFVSGTVMECYYYFVSLCTYVLLYYRDGLLTEAETEMLTHFARTKRLEFPAVNCYFDMLTESEFISDDFAIVDNEEFDEIERRLYAVVAVNPPLATTTDESADVEFVLPARLDVKSEYGSASQLFEKAIEKRFAAVVGENTLRWLDTPSLLDYFCGRLYCGDKVVEDRQGKELVWSHNGAKRMPCKALNALFCHQYQVGNYRRNQIGSKNPPKNYGAIDLLFE